MKIAYNPEATALTAAPSNNDITFDLVGKAIYARGVKFEGTNTTYSVFKKHTSDNSGGYDGLVPVPSYTTTTIRYLREDGNWEVPIMSEAVTDLGTNDIYVTWTKNGVVNDLTVPYASTAALLAKQGGTITSASVWNPKSSWTKVWGQSFTDSSISSDTGDILYYLRAGEYSPKNTELCVVIDGDYYAGTGQYKVWHAGNLTKVSQLDNDSGYLTSLPSHNHSYLTAYGEADLAATRTADYTIALCTGGWASTSAGYGSSYGTTLDVSGYATWYHRLAFRTDGKIEYWQGINTKTMSSLGILAFTSNIPTVTDYYWANVKVSDQSDVSTSPTFANATTTGLLTVSSNSTHKGIKIGNNYINAIDGELIIQNNTAIRFGDDSWDYNVWAGLRYISSLKTIHLGIADQSIFSANKALSGGTLNLPGIHHISSALYNIKVGSIAQHTPSTSGWYTVAQVTGYFNYDIYITGGWSYGMPSTVRANICNINGTSKITQLAGYVGSLCSQIRLGKVSTDKWDVQVYITAQSGTMEEQRCIFTGFGGLTVHHTSTLASTSYSATNTLVFGQISGISLTTDNYTSYLDGQYLPLSGGLMDSDAYISWNNGADGNDVSDWKITSNGLRIISSITTTSNAPTQYSTALHVKGRYGFQLASAGGAASNSFYIKNVHNTVWNSLIHSGNISSQSVNYATSAGNADTVDSKHASDFKYVNVSNYSYTPNLAFYDGGSASTNYYKLSITNVNNIWTMLLVEMSIKEHYSSYYYGKILIHINKNLSNAISGFTVHTLGQLSSSVKAYANNNSDSFDIYIAGNWSWPTLNVDRITFGDTAASTTGKNITLTKVTALPSSYTTASVITGLHSENISSYALTSLPSHTHDYVPMIKTTIAGCDSYKEGLTLAQVSNPNAGHGNHSAFLTVNSIGTPFQLQIPDSSVNYVYKRYKSGSTWSAWSKLSAGYADSAGNADKLGNIDSTRFLHQVVVPNNTENDFNTFSNMTLTGRVDPTTGASLKNAPWSGSGPAGGYGVLTYLFNGSYYGTQMAWEYHSNKIYIRNRYWGGSGLMWDTTWDSLALTSDLTNYMKATKVGSYYGLTTPTGSDSDWIRTTSDGLLPYAAGGITNGHCYIGTSGWYFNSAYISNVNCNTVESSADLFINGTSSIQLKTNTNQSAVVLNTTLFKPFDTAHNKLTLGSNTARWANTYSVLGNFSGLITSSVAEGTAPFVIASTKVNTKLNADMIDDYHIWVGTQSLYNSATKNNSTIYLIYL